MLNQKKNTNIIYNIYTLPQCAIVLSQVQKPVYIL